ncbi:MAG: hypothetical protein ACD_62C00395G0001 [uncultured bacterium]|nr:MAG: hypothetical protein ACD_62C00395G0001 [uncultured bacterium]
MVEVCAENEVDCQDEIAPCEEASEQIENRSEAEAELDPIESGQTGSEEGDAESGDIVMAQLIKKQQELELEISTADIKAILLEIQDAFSDKNHGIELITVAKGYQFRTKYNISQYLRDEKIQAPSRFSPSGLETLAIIAYQQPVTRQKIEEIRGVDSGGVLKTLLDKDIVRLVGRSEEPGRPLVYGTSRKFLEIFGINQLKDLPNLHDYQSLELSALKSDENAQTDRQSSRIDLSDLLDDGVSHLTEEEEEILGHLDESIKNVRRVEKHIVDMHFKQDAASAGDVVEAVVLEQTTGPGEVTTLPTAGEN